MESSVDQQSERLIRELYHHHAALCAFAYSILRDWQLAQDAFQETLIVFLKKYSDIDPDTNVLALAHKVIYFEALGMLRKRQREQTKLDQALYERMYEIFTPPESQQTPIRETLRRCLEKLPPAVFSTVNAFYFHKKSYQQIATTFSCSVETVRKRLFRARQNLRQCMSFRKEELT